MIYIINIAFEFLKIILIIRIALTWFPHNSFHPIIKSIHNISDPILQPFRNMINPIGGIDLSPIIVFFLINYIQQLLIRFLLSI